MNRITPADIIHIVSKKYPNPIKKWDKDTDGRDMIVGLLYFGKGYNVREISDMIESSVNYVIQSKDRHIEKHVKGNGYSGIFDEIENILIKLNGQLNIKANQLIESR